MKYVFKKALYKALIPVLDILGYALFFPSKLFRKKAPKNPKNILVVRLDHIGDFVCTAPLFKNLKKKFPDSKITVLINSVSKELAYRDPDIDKVVTFSPPYLARGDKVSNLKGFSRVVKDIRNIGFDLGIEPRGDLISILIMWLGGVRYRIGYGITGGGFLLSKESRYDESKHVIDRNLTLLEALNIPVCSRLPEVYFNKKDEAEVESLFRREGVRPIQRVIDALGQTPFPDALGQTPFSPPFPAVVIHPFAGAKAKEWTKENFQNLIDRIKKDGRDVLLVGSANDEGRYENVTDLRGKLSLPQLACLIKRTGSFIGLDSGPANIAAALNVPSVIVCSGTNVPQLWVPNNQNVKFIYRDTECKPCGMKVCMKEKHECMESITVEEVMNAVESITNLVG